MKLALNDYRTWFAIGAALLLTIVFNKMAEDKRVGGTICYSSHDEQIRSVPISTRLRLHNQPLEHWQDWDREVYSAAKTMIDNLNSNAPASSPLFDISIAPAYPVRRGNVPLVAGVICIGDIDSRTCRNRNFWGTRGNTPVEFADAVLRNSLADIPLLKACDPLQMR